MCLSIQNVPLLPEEIVVLNSKYNLSVSWDLDNEKLLKKHLHFSITHLFIMLSTPTKEKKKKKERRRRRSVYIKQLLELKTMRKWSTSSLVLTQLHGEELSSSELVSCLTLYLFSTGNEAVADIRKDLAEPAIVRSCIFPTSLQT